MSKKGIYEKPCVIGMLDNSMVYGQEVKPMGMCADGNSPEGSTYGCGAGPEVEPYCGVGIAAESSLCEVGSTPYYGNVCGAGTTYTA